MTNWRVWLRSKAGFYEQYDGYVDVYAQDADDAVQRALQKLRAGSFPDRPSNQWTVERTERR